jgi:hypothetical protein
MKITVKSTVLLFVFIYTFCPSAMASRIYGGFYTKEKLDNIRNNCEKYEWAKKLREQAVKNAGIWVIKPDAELWAMVPGQDLPRCIDVTFDRLTKGPKFLGCLKCGKEISKYGNYPYNPDVEHKPWKLTCPSCKSVFPTNDFGKYYQSGIDEHGVFNPAKGDKTLLYNAAHPDPKDPLHKYGVDDGYGYIDQNGRGHRFIGYYTWKYWAHITSGLNALANAYIYTGSKIYAHKAAILLDRIADLYPDMDWKPYADMGWYHSDGGRHMGKIEGSIWETSVIQQFADVYDKIISGTVNDPELYSFLKKQSQKYKLKQTKGDRESLIKNIDDGLLRTAFQAVLNKQIWGNQGMQQVTVATCAIALNTFPETEKWLDWIFKSDGGNISGLMIRNFDRDGTSDEGAPSYAYMWGEKVAKLGAMLSGYPAYKKHDIFREYPQFGATFLSAYRMAVLGIAIPNIGDSGTTGMVSNSKVNPQFIATGYLYTRHPAMAIAAYRANGNSGKNLGIDICSKNPERLSREIDSIGKAELRQKKEGTLLSGFGMAVLESGKGKTGTGLVVNYGRTSKHAHPDLLNFDLLAFGRWLAPDHGYPEYATKWPSNTDWTGSTISHNLVFVNQQPQKEVWGGHTRMYKQLDGFGVFQIDGKKAYPEIKAYNRTMLLIGGTENDSNAYVIDIFRVEGGHDHVYSFHGPPGTVAVSELALTAQSTGTYAGESIDKGIPTKDFPIGYSHLYNVQKDASPQGSFTLDWIAEAGYQGLTIKDNIHLRMHALTQSDDIALADGDPPQNKPGNPKSLKYVLMHRKGNDLNSTFVSVLEPYRNTPFIKSAKRLDDGKDGQVAIQVDKYDGSTEYILYNPIENKVMKLPQGISMQGTLGYIKKQGDAVKKSVLINGTSLHHASMQLDSKGAFKGKVLKMNKVQSAEGWILVDAVLPTDGTLNGEQIIIDTPYERDATYTIDKVISENGGSKIFCGPVSFIRDYKENQAGVGGPGEKVYLYDFEEGASFKITSHAIWEK